MFEKTLKHPVFKEMFSDGKFTWMTHAIPEFDEYYLGVAATIPAIEKGWFGIKIHTEAYQTVRMIQIPIVLNFILPFIVANESSYDEEKDRYGIIPLDEVYRVAMDKVKEGIAKAYAKIKETYKNDPDTLASIEMLEELKIKAMDEMATKRWMKNISSTTRTLIEEGYYPLWVNFSSRSRTLILLKQVEGQNAYQLTEVTEFMFRDERKNCSFVGLSSIPLNGAVAQAIVMAE